jgi:YD repeat-containing protein
MVYADRGLLLPAGHHALGLHGRSSGRHRVVHHHDDPGNPEHERVNEVFWNSVKIETRSTYDVYGRVTTSVDERLVPTTIEYDEDGHVLERRTEVCQATVH